MTRTNSEKIKAHLVEGKMEPDEEIGIKFDRGLMQDATGTMACLQFEALGIPKPKVEFANSGDYQKINLGSKIKIDKVIKTLKSEARTMQVKVDDWNIEFKLMLTRRLRDILIAGGLLNYTKIKRT
jgi:aconitase A